jgi:type I restriction enzyme S subunit
MSRYETYKETDVIWFKELPAHWKRKRVKDVTQTLAGGTPDTSKEEYWEGNIPWLPSGKVQNSIINEEDADTFITEDGLKNSATKMLPSPATLIALTGATCSNIGYLTFDACANQSVVGMPGGSKMLPKFLFYTLQSQKEQILLHQTGGAQGGISESDVKFLFIPVPSESEQLTIANYLDDQTQKIDRLIANKKAQAEKLKELRQIEINNAVTKGLNPNAEMKDSGIEWLGKIPKHWEVKRLKNILIEKMMYGANEIADDDNENNPRYIRITDFGSNGELRDDTFKSLQMEVAKDYLLDEGDILFARSGATVGKTFQFKNYSGIACFAGYLIKARPNTQIITSDFLFYFTQSNAYENWKNSIFSKATIENIGAEKYQLLKLCVPKSIDEQNEITEYLIKRTTAIDQLIKNIEAQIEKLQELRKIKIYEAVTGKIKVTGDEQKN